MKSFLKTLFWLPLFFPLYLLKSELFGVPINMLEMLILFFAAVFFAYYGWLFVTRFFRSRRKLDFLFHVWAENRALVWMSVALLGLSMLAVAVTPGDILLIDMNTVFASRRVAFGIAKGWIILPFLFFVMLWKLTENVDQLKNLTVAYVLSCLPLIAWAFWQVAAGDFVTFDGRASGPFVNANYLAMYLAPAAVVVFRMLVREALGSLNAARFVGKVLLALAFLMALIFTQSYGAMIGVLVAFCFYLFYEIRISRAEGRKDEVRKLVMLSWFFAVMCLVTLISAFAVFVNTEKWQKLADVTHRSSSAVRVEVYQVAVKMIGESPWTGIGLGQFEAQYNVRAPEILGRAPFEWVMIHPHNTFLAFWLNFGIFGVLAFGALLFWACWSFFTTKSTELSEFRLLAVSMLLVMVVHGMFDTYFFKNDLAMLFWMVMACALLPTKKQHFSEQ